MVETKNKTIRLIAVALIIVFMTSITFTVASARSSTYIERYGSGISAGSNGKITVSFSIAGSSKMDEIGSTKITIYENGTLVKTYLNSTTTGMMASGKVSHAGTVTYSGVKGKSYRAIVTFKCGKDGGYDSRLFETTSVTAK